MQLVRQVVVLEWITERFCSELPQTGAGERFKPLGMCCSCFGKALARRDCLENLGVEQVKNIINTCPMGQTLRVLARLLLMTSTFAQNKPLRNTIEEFTILRWLSDRSLCVQVETISPR